MELKKEKDNYKNGNDGNWENDQRNGDGKIEYNNGNIYDGKRENNKKKGFENEEKFI